MNRNCLRFCKTPEPELPKYVPKKKAKPGYILLEGNLIVSPENFDSENETPIGIVTSSNNGVVTVMALSYADDMLSFGGYSEENNEITYYESENIQYFESLTEDIPSVGKFPSDLFDEADWGTNIEKTDYYYILEGDYEEIPYENIKENIDTPEYAINDIYGKLNTDVLKNEELPDNAETFNAVQEALNETTGDLEWYVPSIGELAKAFLNLKEIDDTRVLKLGLLPVVTHLSGGSDIFSSTYLSPELVWSINFSNGTIGKTLVNDNQIVWLFALI